MEFSLFNGELKKYPFAGEMGTASRMTTQSTRKKTHTRRDLEREMHADK